MSADRRSYLASFFGTVMLLVILRWCYTFCSGCYDELTSISHVAPVVLLSKIERMRPVALQAVWLRRYALVYGLTAVLILAGLWGSGVRQWWRGRRDAAPPGAP